MPSPDTQLKPHLPLEIILQIIETLLPTNPTPIALPPSHPLTKTILSLLRTSRGVYPTAKRLLYTRCLYIDTFDRLSLVTRALTDTAYLNNGLPRVSLLPHIHSLYLAPDFFGDEVNNIGQIEKVVGLLDIIGSGLKRLILSIPTRSMDLTEREIRRAYDMLWYSLSEAKQIEIFSYVTDTSPTLQHWFLDSEKRDVWLQWPKCRVLTMYNPDVSHKEMWKVWSQMPSLERIILNRSDGLREIDMQEQWRLNAAKGRKLDVVVVNVEADHRGYLRSEDWK